MGLLRGTEGAVKSSPLLPGPMKFPVSEVTARDTPAQAFLNSPVLRESL